MIVPSSRSDSLMQKFKVTPPSLALLATLLCASCAQPPSRPTARPAGDADEARNSREDAPRIARRDVGRDAGGGAALHVDAHREGEVETVTLPPGAPPTPGRVLGTEAL